MNHVNSYNQVILIGRIGQDPELKTSKGKNPTSFASFSMATYKKFRSGGKSTTWSHVNYWGDKQAKWACEWLHKGMLVQVNGELSSRKYRDNQGIERRATDVRAYEIIMLASPKSRVEMNPGEEEYVRPKAEPTPATQQEPPTQQQEEDSDDFY